MLNGYKISIKLNDKIKIEANAFKIGMSFHIYFMNYLKFMIIIDLEEV